MLYFAYGSNMDPLQIAKRCPGHQVVGIGLLPSHRLCFPRLSKNRGCGVSSIEPVHDGVVWGVVYRLTPDDVARLDREEGYEASRPAGENRYNRMTVMVTMDGEPTEMQTYVAERQENPPPPNAEYLALMRDGGRHHGLPDAYLAMLDALGEDVRIVPGGSA
jgi:cation transport regulator ChaC